jgi:rhamnulokinase
MPKTIQDYCRRTRQPLPKDRGAIVRCALISLARKYQEVLGKLEDLRGQKIEVLHVIGGGAKNHLLCQWTADACQIPVLAGPVEATAIGNLCVQLMALGKLDSLAEARALIRESFPVKRYDPTA